MCGLFASVGLPVDRSRLRHVQSRGPDGEHWVSEESVAGPVSLGHRRLSIFDERTIADQPMTSRDGAIALIFNGAIYNFRALRSALVEKGVEFRTNSDTEVLLELLVREGLESLHKLEGMFAFVAYNRARGEIWAVRDRFGIKPLYVVEAGGGVAFASEIKQIYDLSPSRGRIDAMRAYDFLSCGLTDHAETTMFQGIVPLRPGHLLRLRLAEANRGPLQQRRWYASPPGIAPESSLADAADRVRELLTASVHRHLAADVPVGACLSGGLDSSSIVGLTAQSGVTPDLTTVSAVFPGEARTVDESSFVDAAVNFNKVKNVKVQPQPGDLLSELDDLIWRQDEPFPTTSIFAQRCVFQAAQAAGLKVMNDGQGADELLAGYHGAFAFRRRQLAREGRLGELLATTAARAEAEGAPLRMLLGAIAPQLRTVVPQRVRDAGRRWLTGESSRDEDWLRSLAASAPKTGSTFGDCLEESGLPPDPDVNDLCRVMVRHSSLPMLLRYEDRNAMTFGIEARVPFLDTALTEFLLTLSDRQKLAGSKTKLILREAMRDVLPPSVYARRDKIGFATPEATWFRGPLKGAMTDMVADAGRRFPELFDKPLQDRLLAPLSESSLPWDDRLWRVVAFSRWADRFGMSL